MNESDSAESSRKSLGFTSSTEVQQLIGPVAVWVNPLFHRFDEQSAVDAKFFCKCEACLIRNVFRTRVARHKIRQTIVTHVCVGGIIGDYVRFERSQLTAHKYGPPRFTGERRICGS